MGRLTFDGNFCDIAQCRELPCPHGGNCTQRKVWEKLKAYEDTGLGPEEVNNAVVGAELMAKGKLVSAFGVTAERLRELAEADKGGRVVVLPSNKALTNADRMRTATNQQLAKLIYDSQKEFCRMLYKNLGFEDELTFSGDYSDILAWLNVPEKTEAAQEAGEDV